MKFCDKKNKFIVVLTIIILAKEKTKIRIPYFSGNNFIYKTKDGGYTGFGIDCFNKNNSI